MNDNPIGRSAVDEQLTREEDLLERVVASFAETKDERLRELLMSLVRHLHSFVREVRLSETEWELAIRFLTRVGQISDERRQEFILLSDVLGVSMQTVAVNNEAQGDATEATVFGPFFVNDAPAIENGGDIAGCSDRVTSQSRRSLAGLLGSRDGPVLFPRHSGLAYETQPCI